MTELAMAMLLVLGPGPTAADTLDAEVVFRIGGSAGDVLFEQVEALEVDSAGRVYVLDGYAHRVRAFSPEGRELWSMGREGEGPGEFTAPVGLAWAPDGTLWVVDPGNQRATVLDPADGGVQGTHRLPSGVILAPWPGRFDRVGRFYHALDDRGDYRVQIGVYDAELREVGRLDPPRSPRPEVVYEGRTARGSDMRARVPFTPRLLWRIDGEGRFVSAWTGELRFTGPAERDRGETGEDRGPPVTPGERRAALDGLARFVERGGRVEAHRIPDRKPVLHTFVLDGGDRIWAVLSPSSGDPGTILRVYDADGAPSTVRIGARIAPHPAPVVREGWMAVVEVDALGVQTIVLARAPPDLNRSRSERGPSTGT